MESLSPVQQSGKNLKSSMKAFPAWNETQEFSGEPREVYRPVLERLGKIGRTGLRGLDERLESAMREMGVTFDVSSDRPWGSRPWYCDLMPQIFTAEEWALVAGGVKQRLRAFEMFLHDIYSDKEILRSGTIPIQPVLGSPYYQRAAAGLKPPGDVYLHLSGVNVGRLADGELVVKHHYFSNASGLSYMIQNRRALARVIPESFEANSISSIADAPTEIIEVLRSFSTESDPTVVLLSSGPGSAVYSEHSFLARRMGIPVVQGGDLLVLNDAVFLKTVSGLEKVEVIYTRISDQWLDPMVFRRDSLLGVPGLVHCIRKGSVTVVNAIGSQVADDRALLPLAPTIIRYYLNERPILHGLQTYWLGDIDQREMVFASLEDFTIRTLYGERILLGGDGIRPTEETLEKVIAEVRQNPALFVAQPQDCDAEAVCYHEGRKVLRRQDHIVFALHKPGGECEVFPGALTRVSSQDSPFTSSELGGGSKDTWVLASAGDWIASTERKPAPEAAVPAHHVTSRVAEAFYWIGRYLERAYSLAGMISVIETLELEELNPTERTLYRPIWNRVLPPLETSVSRAGRSISSPASRYRLTLDAEESGSVVNTILRATRNAETILESLSIDAWGVLNELRSIFQRARFLPKAPESKITPATRRLCEQARQLIPQFFGIAECTMLADGGWRFCEIGQLIERAAITANATCSILAPILKPRAGKVAQEHAEEIRLSAFLRLLNSRDVYRRVYQMRIEPVPMLDLLWKNPIAPRSVMRCLSGCAVRFSGSEGINSPATQRTVESIDGLMREIQQTDWEEIFSQRRSPEQKRPALFQHSEKLMNRVLEIHYLISDGFLNHQIHMRSETQSLFPMKNAL